MESTKSIFVQTFGDSPFVRVLDFFLMFEGFDYSKSQVARETGVSRVTLDGIWAQLQEDSLIIPTRMIGRAQMFRLNKKSPRVKVLLELDFKLSKAAAEEEMALKQGIPATTNRQNIQTARSFSP